VGGYLLPPLLSRFRKKFPEVQVFRYRVTLYGQAFTFDVRDSNAVSEVD
jgi:hypothetical protein